jgi:phosphatidylglycerophosphatase A
MTTKTEVPSSPRNDSAAEFPVAGERKPYLALAIATSAWVGYLPVVPGTFGSFVGVAIYYFFGVQAVFVRGRSFHIAGVSHLVSGCILAVAIALVGVWAADRAAKFLRVKDPNCIVIDEVSGQFLAFLAALAPLNWKYLLLGFILFRVFDIWKPFPAREAESLPGGLGIMADDWIAGIYSAMGLWIARAAGL